MQASESGVIQIESIVIVAVVFVLLACAVVICTSITAAKILHGLPARKGNQTVEAKTGPPGFQRFSLFAGGVKRMMKKGESNPLNETETDIEAPEPDAAADPGGQFVELPDPEASGIGLDDGSLELPEPEPAAGEPDDLDTDAPDDVDTNDFDETFMCEDDGFEYYEDAI